MEQTIIQSNNNYPAATDNFVRAICESHHIDNYYATISVPVLSVVQFALSNSQEVMLSFDYCSHGVQFRVESCAQQFLSVKADPTSEISLLLNLLVDDCHISDEGNVISLGFAIQGIDATMAASRVAALRKFYSPTPSAPMSLKLVN